MLSATPYVIDSYFEYIWLKYAQYDWFHYARMMMAVAQLWGMAVLLRCGLERLRGIRPDPAHRGRRRARFALAGVVIYILFSTLFSAPKFYGHPDLFLFSNWRYAWNDWTNMPFQLARLLYRIATFIPFGLLSVFAFPKLRRVWQASLLSFALAAPIELLQLVFHRGECSMDDVFCYLLGGTLGAAAAFALLHHRNGHPRRAWITLIPWAASMLAIACFFISHALLPYGTLPFAPHFRYPMWGIEVNASIPLSDEPMTATVYRFDPGSRHRPRHIRELEMLVPSPQPYAEETILNPSDVLHKLQRGDCNWDSDFALPLPKTITITKLDLQYFADSRGYLQPVWYIHATSEHGKHGFLFPALP